jgi:hypothetical protein
MAETIQTTTIRIRPTDKRNIQVIIKRGYANSTSAAIRVALATMAKAER